MGWTDSETKDWMKSVGFTDDWIAAHYADVAPHAEAIEKTVMMRSHHSRELDKLQKAQTELAAANDKLTADMAEWAALTASEKDNATKLRADLDESRRKIFSLEQTITRVAEESGQDPKTLLGGEPSPKPKVDEPKAFDPEPLRQQIGGVASYMLRLNAKLPGIAREYESLTGQPFDVDGFISGIEADIRSNKTDNLEPMARYEKAFDIPSKRTAKAEEKRQSELAAAREEGRRAAASERDLPNVHPREGSHSPVFQTPDGKARTSVLQRPNNGTRLVGAVEALRTGKYRTGGSGHAA